jgi:hydroxypyruvate reductase
VDSFGRDDARALLRTLFDAALRAADPAQVVPQHLPPPPRGRTVVVGAGKAAAAMARAVEANWPADKPLTGLVVTRYGHGVGPLRRIEVVEASHPVPETKIRAKMLACVSQSRANRQVILLDSTCPCLRHMPRFHRPLPRMLCT